MALTRITSIQFFVFFGVSMGYDYFQPGAIHFPLRNVQESIRLDTFSMSEQNITYGKCEHISNPCVIVNLQNLGMLPPPNPYPGFIDSDYVTCLNLASNEIYQVVPGSFDRMRNLNYLDLSQNRIQFCDFFNFGSPHPSLVTMIIEDNIPPTDNIERVISKSDCFPKLRYLYLRRNSIRGLNFSLKKSFPVLTHLFLSDNNLDSKNFIHDLPPTLTHLYLERNLISGLDCRIMKDLQYLYLDDNIIRSICHHKCQDTSLKLEGVHKLTTLSISKNRITEIESCAFQEAQGLMSLNLAENSLEEIKRETFDKLVMLRELNLDDNHLITVPNLCNNNQLVSVSLRRNKLQMIRHDYFKNLRSLKYLYLGSNNIQNIEVNSFEDLECLTELDLSNNNLDFIPSDWLKWQRNLRILDVHGNKFKSLEQMSIGYAPSLSIINMQNNPVTHISGSIVMKLAPNVMIQLQNSCSDKTHTVTDCYTKCDEVDARTHNETYMRWINNL